MTKEEFNQLKRILSDLWAVYYSLDDAEHHQEKKGLLEAIEIVAKQFKV